ncbi:hypothetical protein DPMN_090690 [Dreissena polymorpha]|uniref:Uncharacterized protein n=3 Tax=Dreissena polymorpha TaxID=45954 RepID=A0A9D4KY71_DREPO|nr:hypothetical protein DPMN_090690 [Dreissena polymorpha]
MSSLSDEIDEDSVCTPPLFTPPPEAPIPPPPPFSRTAYTTTTNGKTGDLSNNAVLNADPVSEGQRAYIYACSAIP